MKIGFTGTQQGMTEPQKETVEFILRNKKTTDDEFHHGDCVGADEQAWKMAFQLYIKTVGHPPKDPSKRAFTSNDENWPEEDYLVRNHHIVDECELLIATPGGPEKLRSGTWATIRYAKKIGRDTAIISPDGTITLS